MAVDQRNVPDVFKRVGTFVGYDGDADACLYQFQRTADGIDLTDKMLRYLRTAGPVLKVVIHAVTEADQRQGRKRAAPPGLPKGVRWG